MSRIAVRLTFVLSLAAVGCGDDSAPVRASAGDLASICEQTTDCRVGECTDLSDAEAQGQGGRYCTTTCANDQDCSAYGADAVCGHSGHCILSCDAPNWDNPTGNPIACVEGKPVDCKTNGGALCDACGCPAEGEYCDDASNSCKPHTGYGKECATDEECPAFSCGLAAQGDAPVCLAHLGEACTASDCPRCVDDGTTSYCTIGCDDPDAPITMAWGRLDFICITDLDTNKSWYKLRCASDTDCLTQNEVCLTTRDGDASFCDPRP